jgi:D-alanyl-D-alanine carboxypeptidase
VGDEHLQREPDTGVARPKEMGMLDVQPSSEKCGVPSRSIDRRTLLAGAVGALAAAGLSGPARATGSVTAVATRQGIRFDPALGHRLQKALHDALSDPGTHFPGVLLHVQSPALGAWTGVAGLSRLAPATPMRRHDRFRAGSIVKPFVSVVVLQLAERGRLSLDARLPEVLPPDVTGRFANAAEITVRMLLGHRSGIPEWDTEAIDLEVARDPWRVWKVSEFLDLAAAQPPVLAPGTGFFYSNTDYNLLGLIIERITRRSWRHEVARRVIGPLRLSGTSLPAPGDRSIMGPHAHGYALLDGRTFDLTRVDPSFAGAAGASALITTTFDLARFLDALFKGRLFRRRRTLRQMLELAPAQGEGGLVGYGLGIERRALPGGAELIGHLGGAPGYRSYVGRVRPPDATISFALNTQEDPTPLVIPVVQALGAT